MAVIGIVAAVVICAACLRKGIIKTIKKQIPFAIICAIPFVWIAFVQNHSAIHARFTFRILSITFLGIAGMGICASRMLSDKNVKSE